MLWDKTDDVYRDRNETKKAWREVCVCLQEHFETLQDAQKNAFGEYCHNLLNAVDLNSYFFFHFMYSAVHIFDICQEAAPASARK